MALNNKIHTRCGIVLCGGQSRRMGTAKYALRLGSETLLQRICRIVRESTGTVVVVAAPEQEIPELGEHARVIRDDRPGDGPLAGIARGLSFLNSDPKYGNVETAFVTSCDAPLLRAEVVDFLLNMIGEQDAVVIRENGRLHPLCAVYRKDAATAALRLLDEGERRPRVLLQTIQSRFVEAEQIRQIDPKLDCLLNVNTQEEFHAMLKSLGEEAAPA